jgi:hypothetical protein
VKGERIGRLKSTANVFKYVIKYMIGINFTAGDKKPTVIMFSTVGLKCFCICIMAMRIFYCVILRKTQVRHFSRKTVEQIIMSCKT